DVMSVGITSTMPVSSGSVIVKVLPLRSRITRLGSTNFSTVPRKRIGAWSCAAVPAETSTNKTSRQRAMDGFAKFLIEIQERFGSHSTFDNDFISAVRCG